MSFNIITDATEAFDKNQHPFWVKKKTTSAHWKEMPVTM